jgi:hypothetical protein
MLCPIKKRLQLSSLPLQRTSQPSDVRICFSANKLDARFDRAREGGSDIFISYEAGSPPNSLYERDYEFASDDPEVRCTLDLELEEVDSSDNDDNCDESN